MATLGNAADFGDLSQQKAGLAACAGQERGIISGGWINDAIGSVNTIEYITFSTAGNAVDFGDLILPRDRHASTSTCHGGI